MSPLLVRWADPPLDPSGDEGRRALRRELVKPEYYDHNLVQRLLDWLRRRAESGVDRASGTPSLTWFAATLIAVLLVAGIGFLLSRARLTAREQRERAVLVPDEHVTAAELRERARRALAEGRTEDAVIDGFRALAVAQVERGRLDDLPGATAHEVAAALAREFPDLGRRVDTGAALFDAVLYGERTATHDQAAEILDLDASLARSR